MPLDDDRVEARRAIGPRRVLIGHSGSTSAHPIVAELTRAHPRKALPAASSIVYGGVFPTYHWRDVLAAEPQIDVDRARRRRGDGAAPDRGAGERRPL